MAQSLFNIYVIESVCEHVCSCNNDVISETKPVKTISTDSNFVKSTNPTVDTVVNSTYLASLFVKSTNPTVNTVVDNRDVSSLKNNLKSRVESVPSTKLASSKQFK